MKKSNTKQYDFSFAYMQRLPWWNTNTNVGYWVCRKGRIFPVAVIDYTPYIWRVNWSRLNKEDEKKMRDQFMEFLRYNSRDI